MATESFSKNFKVSKFGADEFTKQMVRRSSPLTDPEYRSHAVTDPNMKKEIMDALKNSL